MGAGHGHGHVVRPGPAGGPQDGVGGHAGRRYRSRLWVAFGLLATFMVVEAAAAWWTGSLALLSDAGHMFTDVLGIGLALAAIHAAGLSTRHPQRTFGLYRLEVLAALANAFLLAGVALFVLVEAVRRIGEPPEVAAVAMLSVAVAGLAANLVAFALLRRGAQESINVRGAYLEVLADLVGSVAVIIAALVIVTTGWWYADPLMAAAVGAFILPRAWRLGRSALRILVQAAPEHVDVGDVRGTLAAVDGVSDVHDLHVWTLTSGMDVASAHLNIHPGTDLGAVLRGAREALHDRHGIDHATLQVEPDGVADACHRTGW